MTTKEGLEVLGLNTLYVYDIDTRVEIKYYSRLGEDEYVYCVSGIREGNPYAHRVKLRNAKGNKGRFIVINGKRYYISDFIM